MLSPNANKAAPLPSSTEALDWACAGESASVVFTPYGTNISINLGTVTLPYTFEPYLLTPPYDVYGVYSILVVNGDCPIYLTVPPPTPSPTPTITPTRTQTPTPTPTVTPLPDWAQGTNAQTTTCSK
jgi:hypothetical protein